MDRPGTALLAVILVTDLPLPIKIQLTLFVIFLLDNVPSCFDFGAKVYFVNEIDLCF